MYRFDATDTYEDIYRFQVQHDYSFSHFHDNSYRWNLIFHMLVDIALPQHSWSIKSSMGEFRFQTWTQIRPHAHAQQVMIWEVQKVQGPLWPSG